MRTKPTRRLEVASISKSDERARRGRYPAGVIASDCLCRQAGPLDGQSGDQLVLRSPLKADPAP
jgi:hypothetical protein